MLAAYRAWGIEAALQRFVGMFAFALWDRERRDASCSSRDRLGEKPLYYGCAGAHVPVRLGAKALRRASRASKPSDRSRRARRSTCATATCRRRDPSTQGIRKLPPGTIADVRCRRRGPRRPRPTGRRDEVVRRAASPHRFAGSDGRGRRASSTRCCATRSRQRMIADVPLGAFLSGGIDSSTVVALMQAQSARAGQTFTIGFDDAAYNEAPLRRGGRPPPRHRPHRALRDARRRARRDPAACRRSTTSRSPTRRRSRRSSCRSWRAST